LAKSNSKNGFNRTEVDYIIGKNGKRVHPKSLQNLRRGGPGRPKGSRNFDGFYKALTAMSHVIGKEKNLKKLEEALQAYFDKDPVLVLTKIIAPTMPKNINFNLENDDGKITIILQGPKKLPSQNGKKEVND